MTFSAQITSDAVPTIGCAGGGEPIRPTLTYGRSAAAGRTRRRKSKTNSTRGASASRRCPGSRGNRSLAGTRCGGSQSPGANFVKQFLVSRCCTHLKGDGGANHLAANRFVLRTDVKSQYDSIDHLMLLDQLAVHIKDRRVLNLIGPYLRRGEPGMGKTMVLER
jgi:hypothetical protein